MVYGFLLKGSNQASLHLNPQTAEEKRHAFPAITRRSRLTDTARELY